MTSKLFALIFINCAVATSFTSSHITQVVLSKCNGSSKYTTTCFKLDLLRLISTLSDEMRLRLAPGVAIIGTDSTKNLVQEIGTKLVLSPRSFNQIDNFITSIVEKFIKSLNFTVQLGDSNLIAGARHLITDTYHGRLKKPRWAFLWTVLAILFAVLAGLSGSALVASLIALVLSGITLLRAALGGGAAGFAAPPSGFGYALPVSHTASGRITAYEISPDSYMDDNSHQDSTPLAFSAYARQSPLTANISRLSRPYE